MKLWSEKIYVDSFGNDSCLVLIPTVAILSWSHLLIGRLREACLWSTVS